MSPTYSPLAVFLKVPMVAMILPFRFRDHDHHGLDGLGHDRGCRGRSRRPASLLEDGSAALFCLARKGGAAARGKKGGAAVAAPSGSSEARFGYQSTSVRQSRGG